MKYTPNKGLAYKTCCTCQLVLSKDNFRHNKGRGGDGLSSACKACLDKSSREWKAANREVYLEQQRAYNKARKV